MWITTEKFIQDYCSENIGYPNTIEEGIKDGFSSGIETALDFGLWIGATSYKYMGDDKWSGQITQLHMQECKDKNKDFSDQYITTKRLFELYINSKDIISI